MIPRSDIILEVKNLKVNYSIHEQLVPAVRGIDFSVLLGDTLGIVGESGSGKSTAIQALLRLDSTPTIDGSVLFMGEELLTKTQRELGKIRGKEIGMIFQDPMTSLNPTITIGNQLIEGMIYHGLCNREIALKKAIYLLEKVGISNPELRMNQYPHHLSGGMRQRVLIAMAISCDPILLIADEPTTALDRSVAQGILQLLKSLNIPLIIVTHDLSIVAQVCKNVAVMYAGKIIESGPVSQLFNKPRHPYTKLLLESVPSLTYPKNKPLKNIIGFPPNPLHSPSGCPFNPRCPLANQKCIVDEPSLENGVACWRSDD